ncbi:hypothetical protein lotta81_gp017 [Flavobacterium phage vB_FspM_lotta8-1]|uniref:Uncharacterized protein n=3 Tax=Pippivirus TaxID=2843435 RepID=A0A6B9LH42_9CAUD|nr:hypothetical protein HWC85_gp17 [Flavobacterium phage vB_FspM_lotta8-1]YP_009854547.1 hypothetical protein HWC86_gp16 [Flavobacterium phage vB_FspM_pippi8-1]QHB38475.1 hypothetical protein lotta81_gp017 [Flavobacterium phage vB_FspM_lotta8-1]QHB38527.1 hypothetical protein lotta82_gp016 [Flavobacterium phage vB_FspM_lotta8-2]QHB38580.1 hypothetical protein pippi81_gp016 [Flavobacterium phage vB_FspM_pippi8-1]
MCIFFKPERRSPEALFIHLFSGSAERGKYTNKLLIKTNYYYEDN